MSIENVEQMEEQLLTVRKENEILSKNIIEIRRLNKQNEKEIELYESKKFFPNQINLLTQDLKKHMNKKHDLFSKDKSVQKSLSAIKFFIDSVAQVLEQTSDLNKKVNGESEARLKSKIIKILGENLLLLQDIVNMDEVELDQKMVTEEFLEFLNCKILEVDHVTAFKRSVTLKINEEGSSISYVELNSSRNIPINNNNNIISNSNMNNNALKIVDDSEEKKINEDEYEINKNTEIINEDNKDKINFLSNNNTLPPLKNEKNLLKKANQMDKDNEMKVSKNYLSNKLNYINVITVNNPKFSSNFGKFHLRNSVVTDKLKKSYNDSSPNPSKSLVIPKNIYSKYEYLNSIGPEENISNKIKINKYNFSNQKTLLKNKVNSGNRYNKLSPIKFKPDNISSNRFNSNMDNNSNRELDLNVNQILEMNLNIDYSKTSDEDYNNLLYKRNILIESLKKTDQLIITNKTIFDKKYLSQEAELLASKQKLKLIFEENNLYNQEIDDLSELIRLYYEDIKENNNIRKSTLMSTSNVCGDNIPRDMSLTNLDILNEMNQGNNTNYKNSKNSTVDNNQISQDTNQPAFITSGGKNVNNSNLSIVNERWSQIAESKLDIYNVSASIL